MKPAALFYYFSSIRTLLRGIENPGVLVSLLFRKSGTFAARLRLRNGLFFLVRSLLDVWIVKETCLDRQYEQASLPLRDGWTVVDVGAALGDYAVWAARQIPTGRLIAVEPWPPSVSLLRTNLDKNRVYNAEIFEGALAAADGKGRLTIHSGRAVQNSTTAESLDHRSLEVNTSSLASLMEQYSITHCDYLKMDCEGGEYEILFSSSPQALARVDRICMEIHDGMQGHDRAEMIAFLEKNGYRTRLTANPVHDDLAYLYAARPTS